MNRERKVGKRWSEIRMEMEIDKIGVLERVERVGRW